MSGELVNLKNVPSQKQKCLFPQSDANRPYAEPDQLHRYYMSMPFYPFRTLCPRDLSSFPITRNNELTSSSPIFPANTQIDITFKKRNVTNFLDFMLPFNLNPKFGSAQEGITTAERYDALKFRVGVGAGARTYRIRHVDIVLNNLYLPVRDNAG